MIAGLIAHKLSYLGMFFLLAGSGLVSPIPEELTLLTGGYFLAVGFMDPLRAVPIAMLAVLTGDSILFFLAKTGSHYAKGIHEKFKKIGLEKTWIFSPDHPLRAVFILRFFTGFRMISPVFAGFNEASWIGFILTDLAAIVIFVPTLFFLGYHFNANFLEFIALFELVRHLIFWSLVAFVGGEVLMTISPTLHRVVARLRGKKAETNEPNA